MTPFSSLRATWRAPALAATFAATFILSTTLLVATPARAEGICEANAMDDDAPVKVSGKVVSADEEGGYMTITDDCGEIDVVVSDEDALCEVDTTLTAEGVMSTGAVIADSFSCE